VERWGTRWFIVGLLALMLPPTAAGAEATPARRLPHPRRLAGQRHQRDPPRSARLRAAAAHLPSWGRAWGVDGLAAINDPTTDVRVVTLDIGGNDLVAVLEPGSSCFTEPKGLACQQALATVLTAFATNYGLILARLTTTLAADPGDERILVLTYYNHLSGTVHPSEQVVDAVLPGPDLTVNCAAPQATWGLNNIIVFVGAQCGVAVADVYPRFVGKGPTLTGVAEGGDFHPNDAGYAIIANTFMRASRR
jgi:GDSL-like lipase/acylhydrolase family protein